MDTFFLFVFERNNLNFANKYWVIEFSTPIKLVWGKFLTNQKLNFHSRNLNHKTIHHHKDLIPCLILYYSFEADIDGVFPVTRNVPKSKLLRREREYK